MPGQNRKKLIEVSLPLDAVNEASANEKSIHHGHPSTSHLYWARRPLASARAVIWASLVDDPSEHPEKFPTPKLQDKERERLFKFLSELVKWENINDKDLLAQAHAEILKSFGNDEANLPELLDPFAGGGSIPLEGQRLGLKVHAHDLNPVAVMINKAMIEIPPKYCDKPPVNPEWRSNIDNGETGAHGTFGLASDVEYYANRLKSEAYKKLANLYPKVKTAHGDAVVIAWLWARTVKCPNPKCACEMPLAHSLLLSNKKGAYIDLIFDDNANRFNFEVKHEGEAKPGTVTRSGAVCPHCKTPVDFQYIRGEAKSGRMGARMTAIVAEGIAGRVYLDANDKHVKASVCDLPEDYPDGIMPPDHHFGPRLYGIPNFASLFTNRQLKMLVTFSDLIPVIRDEIKRDAINAGLNEQLALEYAQDVSVYLAFVIDKLADYDSTICSWNVSGSSIRGTFGRQAIPMVWDFTENNPFSNSAGCLDGMLGWIIKCIKNLPANGEANVKQFPAQALDENLHDLMISTDPPYYDNIGYADLSDYFYIWMRQNLREVYPNIFATLSTPKSEEIVALPHRHGGDKQAAKEFFETEMSKVCKNLYNYARDDIPVTIYYAYKQQDNQDNEGTASSGWETMLNAIIEAGFMITGTWPMRTERQGRTNSIEANALSSSIVLVCRKRDKDAGAASLGEFMNELDNKFAAAISTLQASNISPVDLQQAAIGPGMAVYSKYNKVIGADGTPVTVRDALKIINNKLDKLLGVDTGEFDAGTLFCIELYKLNGYDAMKFGEAQVIANAKNIVIDTLKDIGAVDAGGGEVRLRRREEYFDANSIKYKTWKDIAQELIKKCGNNIWCLTQSFAYALKVGGGEACGWLLWAAVNNNVPGEKIKSLAYRLYSLNEHKNDAQESLAYNSLVAYWQTIKQEADKHKRENNSGEQLNMFK